MQFDYLTSLKAAQYMYILYINIYIYRNTVHTQFGHYELNLACAFSYANAKPRARFKFVSDFARRR